MTADSWQRRAACGMGDESLADTLALFFPDHPHELDKIDQAKQICAGCPVRRECLEDALAWPADMDGGIRGGYTEWERHDMRRQPTVDVTPDLPPHGTLGRYIREVRSGQGTCPACRGVNARSQQTRRHLKKQAG